ncbi:unnamed protein product [Urochloa decumbens]|uniref:NB-ARC domain-containing protein n=1 Tax=Urochloa decumbens TaxID=240449 RepID=A0ABC9GC17_9POAL
MAEVSPGNQTLEVSIGNQTAEVPPGNQTSKLSIGNQTTEVPSGNQTSEVSIGNQTPKMPHGNNLGHMAHTRQFVDVGGHVENLIKKLENTSKVVFVVGFGGVGKTTLVREVSSRLQAQFPYQAMVSVSQAFEPSRDLNKLLESICDKIVKLRSNDSREAIHKDNLSEYLSDKRYLIVIDDVWTVQAWVAIQSNLQAVENKGGGRILVTTRIGRVAEVFSSDIYPMKALEKEESKKLFLKKVFDSTKDDVCPKDLKDAMENIIEKCGGMALAIVSIASILEGYRSNGDKDKWEKVYKSIGSDIVVGNNPKLERIRHIVALSYNHLPHELKGCMMYLSIFPEDYAIDKNRLLSRWIAEGLVPEKRGWTQMEVAEAYLDELVSRNMVIPHYGYDEEVESCRVHDILLEILVSKSLECNFGVAQEAEENKPPGEVQPKKKMTGGGGSIKGMMDVEHVRSLSMFKVKEQELLKDLKKFTLLRVLDLEGYEGLTDDHMNDVCRLYLLRFLSIKGTNVKEMPSQNKDDWKIFWNLRRGIKNMKALRELHLACLKDDAQVVAEGLGELQNLQHIGIYIDCGDSRQVLETLASSLSKLVDSLRTLNISNISRAREHKGGSLKFLDDDEDMEKKPPRQLRVLRLEGVLGNGGAPSNNRLPRWVGSSLTCLVKIVIMHTELAGDNLFGVLYQLPKLKIIVLEQNFYVDTKIVAHARYEFPALCQLIVNSDTPNPKIFRFEAGSMSKLETLCIRFDNHERSIDGINTLTKLKEVILVGKKTNTCLKTAVGEAKDESKRRLNEPELDQFRVVATYY